MKRRSARAIIILDDNLYLMYREKKLASGKKKKYYSLPGGGIKKTETPQKALLREIKEEFSVDIEVCNYLGEIEEEDKHQYFYYCKYVKGKFLLGGEESIRNSQDNYYEIRKVDINKLSDINIYYLDIIKMGIEIYKKEVIK